MLTDNASSEHDRNRIVGVWAAVGGAALPAGPFIGGALTQVAGWRWVFWLNVPVIAAAVATVMRTSRPTSSHDDRAVDLPGATALVVTVGALVSGTIEGTRRPAVLVACGVLAIVGAFSFALIERRASHPLLTVPSGRRLPLGAACGVAALMNLTVLGSLFLLTQLLQTVHGSGPLRTGVLMLPAMAPLPLVATPAGRLVSRVGPWPTAAVGLAGAALGFGLMAAATAGTHHPLLMVGFTCWGIGIGVLTPGVVAAALNAVPEAAGLASGAINTARQTGAALGVALFGTVAGAASEPQFAHHVSRILWCCSAAFAVTAAACATASRPAAALPRVGDQGWDEGRTSRRQLRRGSPR